MRVEERVHMQLSVSTWLGVVLNSGLFDKSASVRRRLDISSVRLQRPRLRVSGRHATAQAGESLSIDLCEGMTTNLRLV